MNHPRQALFYCLTFWLLWPGGIQPAIAENLRASPSLYGPLGLNAVPSARMDESGTVKAGVSALDPYLHGWLGVQIAEPLYLSLRQSAETSGLTKEPDRLYPGVDIKWRLLEEDRARPEIALGLQSAIGHKRMAGEYIAASKRHGNFDFTAGLGWGRLGSAAHFENPFSKIFRRDRAPDGEDPAGPEDWFGGRAVGLFGGAEYFTPVDGLSVKVDYGADRYVAERQATGFKALSPWSAGLNYAPAPGIDIGIAAQGTDKIMGRVTLSGLIQNWRNRNDERNKKPFVPLLRRDMEGGGAQAHLALEDGLPAPGQIAAAARNVKSRTKESENEITITPRILSLKGPSVRMIRADVGANGRSAAEIWHNTAFGDESATQAAQKIARPDDPAWPFHALRIRLDNRISLSEEDNQPLYRAAVVAGSRTPGFRGMWDNFYSLRLNLSDNLERLNESRPPSALPVRGDVGEFAKQRLGVETMFSAFTHSFRPDLHLALLGGYLEEMYGGFGGEAIYRPFDSRLSVGAESWLAFKRDPLTSLNLGFNGDSLLTGHVNLWYDLPLWNATATASAGRYLAEDLGGTLGLQRRFDNGAMIEGFVTLTGGHDIDPFGSAPHAYSGVRLSVPLGGFRHAPRNTDITVTAAPFGRTYGQRLENPLPLHELTQPFTAQHMAQHWNEVTQQE